MLASLATALSALPLLLVPVVGAQSPPPVLVYSRTLGYRHESIPVAIDALASIAQNTSLYDPTFSEDPSLFTDEQLQPFKAVVFLSNSEEVLDLDGQAALARWLGSGGSLIGLHAGSACLFNDTAFGTALGSWFDYHPDLQNVTFTKLMSHPTIDMLPDRYTYVEEAHHFRSDPRSVNCTVLLSYDTSLVDDPAFGTRPYYQGTPPPIAWFREGETVDLTNGTAGAEPATMTGRTWFTSLGHTSDFWRDELNLAHIEAGFRWALEDFTSSDNSTSATSSAPSSTGSNAAATTATSAETPTPTSGATLLSRATGVALLALSAALVLL